MRAGALNRLVTVYGLPPSKDDWGHHEGQRPNLGRMWASIGRLSGKALIRAGGLQAEVTMSVRVRYGAVQRLGLLVGMWVECGQSVFEIRVILQDEAGREYADLVCSEVMNA